MVAGLGQFGIFSPVMGQREDMPSLLLPAALTPDCANIHMRYAEVRRAKMRAALLLNNSLVAQTPGSDEQILHYHWLEKADGTGHLFGFTADEVYRWDTATKAWVAWSNYNGDGTGGLTTATEWSTATYDDQVIATNNVDFVLGGDESTELIELGTEDYGIPYDATPNYCTKAKFVFVLENYLFLGNTYEGTDYRHRLRWCDLGDETIWDSGDAGSLDLPGLGTLTAAGLLGDDAIIFKKASVHRLWLTAGDLIFENEQITSQIGCDAPKSLVNGGDGDLYFYATDKTIRGMRAGEISRAIDPTLKTIPDDYMKNIQALRAKEYDELWWAIPEGAGATANNKIAVWGNGVWTYRDLPVVAFGTYEEQTNYTWNTLPYSSWDDWDWDSWDSAEGGKGFPIDIGSDSGGITYALHASTLDAGAAYTGHFVLATDLAEKKALTQYKRLLNLRLYFRGEVGGTVSLLVKRDHEAAWQSAGAVALAHTAKIFMVELPVDYRARHFLIKLSAANKFRFLGMVFDYTPDGMD